MAFLLYVRTSSIRESRFEYLLISFLYSEFNLSYDIILLSKFPFIRNRTSAYCSFESVP